MVIGPTGRALVDLDFQKRHRVVVDGCHERPMGGDCIRIERHARGSRGHRQRRVRVAEKKAGGARSTAWFCPDSMFLEHPEAAARF